MPRAASTFFTKPIRWNAGVKRGFIVRPKNDASSGWGEPFVDAEGNPIVPGTAGGPYDRAYLGIKEGKWRVIRKRNWQEAANIDWKGPWTSQAKDKRRIVTCHGPQQRYWNSGTFEYGSEQQHRYIYSNGTIIGIAPSPVLGACIQIHEELLEDGISRERAVYVVAICKEGPKDVVYVTRQYLQLLREGIDDELLETHGSVNYQGSEDPKVTWLQVGESEGYTDSAATVDPEAPWFFDEDGQFARTMRRAIYSHDEFTADDQGPVSYDDTLYRELRVRVNLEEKQAVFTQAEDLDQSLFNNKWFLNLKTHREQEVEWIQPAEGIPASGGNPAIPGDPDGEPHKFREDWATTSFYMVGSSKVAVDYDPDRATWVYGWMRGQYYRAGNQYWTVGEDDGVTYGITNPNTGTFLGPKPKPDPYIPRPGDHYSSQWFGCSEEVGFHITEASSRSALDSTTSIHQVTVQWGKSGDASVQGGGENDPDNPYLAFWDSYTTYIQYADLRSGLLVGYIYMHLYEVSNQTIISEETQWAGVASDPFDLPQIQGETTNSYLFMRYAPRPPTGGGFPISWPSNIPYAGGEEGWDPTESPVDEDVDYVSYSGTLTTANSSEDLWRPSWQSGYQAFYQAEVPKPRWEKVSLVEAIYTPSQCDINGVMGSTELGESLVHLEYFDKVQKDNVAKSHSWGVEGDPMEEVADPVTKITPGGLV